MGAGVVLILLVSLLVAAERSGQGMNHNQFKGATTSRVLTDGNSAVPPDIPGCSARCGAEMNAVCDVRPMTCIQVAESQT